MVSKIFIDSDVIIDFFTDREPFSNPASELFDLNEQGKLELHI
jgi:predicted nucleic acid-binding protein